MDGLVAVNRAELSAFQKDGQELVVLNLHLHFSSFAAAAAALSAIGAEAKPADAALEPVAKPAKAVAAAVKEVAEKAAPVPAAAKPTPVAPKPQPPKPAAPKPAAPTPPAEATQKATAAVAASGGPRPPAKAAPAAPAKPAAAPAKPAAAAPKPKPAPAPEPEPEVAAPELSEFQAQALEALREAAMFKDVILWLIAAYGGEGDAFDASAVDIAAITADVQALRSSIAAIDRVPEADLADRTVRGIESLLAQRAAG